MAGEKQDDLIDRLVQDPNNPRVKKLVGFRMGKSNQEEYWRLYLTDDLNHFLDFRKEDTLHAEQVSSTKTLVWLNPNAEVKESIVRSGRVDFLRGTIIEDHLRRRPGSSGTGPRGLLFAMAGAMAGQSGCLRAGGDCGHPQPTFNPENCM